MQHPKKSISKDSYVLRCPQATPVTRCPVLARQDATPRFARLSGSRLFEIKPISIRFAAIWDLTFLGQVKMEARSSQAEAEGLGYIGPLILGSLSVYRFSGLSEDARFTWPFDSCFFGSA
jgi:hypothetical protein